MPKPRCLACFYVVLFILGCTYCGKEAAPAPLPAQESDADLRPARSRVCATCGAGTFCNSLGVCVPDAWHCGPMYYGAGASDGCDCDCGAPDPDCDWPSAPRWCYAAGRTSPVRQCSECGGMTFAAPDSED